MRPYRSYHLNVIGIVSRRDLLACSAALLGARALLAAKARINKSRVSAITDEIGRTQDEALEFAKRYALQWVELRNVPGTNHEFAFLPETELKRHAAALAATKLKVDRTSTRLNSSHLG